jgi:Ferredoxin-thioredoxin reductase, catalytic subunit
MNHVPDRPAHEGCKTGTSKPTKEDVLRLYDQLKNLQEPKGFFFNNDRQMVEDLLAQLLTTKARYGYMACPCRMANGKRELDKDIICPCRYREPDMEEYGACFCGLYVSKAWNDGEIPHDYVPERRPPECILL